ncbi:TetR family transcriptional regulator [Gillisia mitskevichiae]|uniref:TetR family transcriptional regulator n=1 Tax=Gillisia mitskevichiae TaxID=270921 RepID=A0A495PVN8_9FLAO|nr:TetR/AcrR family transcriptional regulator [Gillisia mitskevichiae]RKS53548.1 TetR family transcriptional regulator [Gillisia mitskevichiae]
MARTKQYKEEDVIQKAMNLFWRNGYEGTSVRMLEKEMGINQFSIYASFGSKHGVFVESIKAYKSELNSIRNVLKNSNNGVLGIKQFFYDFLEFTKENEKGKGCLVCNTVSELGNKAEPDLMVELMKFTEELRTLFINNLQQDKDRSEEMIEKAANFLTTAMLGLSLGSRIENETQLEDYIEMTFKKL